MSGITIQSQPSNDVAANGDNTFTVTNDRAVPDGAGFSGISSSGSKVQLTSVTSHTIQAGDSVYVNFGASYTDGYYEVITVTSTTVTIDLTADTTGSISGSITISNTNVKTIARIYKLTNCRAADTYDNTGSLSFTPKQGTPSNEFTTSDYIASFEFGASQNVFAAVTAVGANVDTGETYSSSQDGYIGVYNPNSPDLVLYLKDYESEGVFELDMTEISSILNVDNYTLPDFSASTGVFSAFNGEETVSYFITFSSLIDDYTYSGGVRTFSSVVEKTADLIYSDVVRRHNIYLNNGDSLSDYLCAVGSAKPFLSVIPLNDSMTIRKGEKITFGFYTAVEQVKLTYASTPPATTTSAIYVENKRGYITLDYDDLTAGLTYLVQLTDTSANGLSDSINVYVDKKDNCNTIAVQFLNHLGSFDIYTFNKNRLKSNVSKSLIRDINSELISYKNKTMRMAELEGHIEHPLRLEALKDLYRLKDVYYIDTDGETQIKTHIRTNDFIEFDKGLFIPNIELYLKNENEAYD